VNPTPFLLAVLEYLFSTKIYTLQGNIYQFLWCILPNYLLLRAVQKWTWQKIK